MLQCPSYLDCRRFRYRECSRCSAGKLVERFCKITPTHPVAFGPDGQGWWIFTTRSQSCLMFRENTEILTYPVRRCECLLALGLKPSPLIGRSKLIRPQRGQNASCLSFYNENWTLANSLHSFRDHCDLYCGCFQVAKKRLCTWLPIVVKCHSWDEFLIIRIGNSTMKGKNGVNQGVHLVRRESRGSISLLTFPFALWGGEGSSYTSFFGRTFWRRVSDDQIRSVICNFSLYLFPCTASHFMKINSFACSDRYSIKCRHTILVTFCAYKRIKNPPLQEISPLLYHLGTLCFMRFM